PGHERAAGRAQGQVGRGGFRPGDRTPERRGRRGLRDRMGALHGGRDAATLPAGPARGGLGPREHPDRSGADVGGGAAPHTDPCPEVGVGGGGKHGAFFDLSSPAHQIDQLPELKEIGEYRRYEADPTYRWSMRMYHRLMNGFNAFHEQVYQTVKDRVNGKN